MDIGHPGIVPARIVPALGSDWIERMSKTSLVENYGTHTLFTLQIDYRRNCFNIVTAIIQLETNMNVCIRYHN